MIISIKNIYIEIEAHKTLFTKKGKMRGKRKFSNIAMRKNILYKHKKGARGPLFHCIIKDMLGGENCW